MRHLCFLFLLITISILLSSCKKKDNEIDPIDIVDIPTGQAQSDNNGVFWSFICISSKSIKYPGKYDLTMNHYNANGFLRGQMTFQSFEKEIGVYYPGNYIYESGSSLDSIFHCSFNTVQADGDAIGDPYVIAKDSAVVFTIDQIKTNGEVEGTFGGTFIKKIIETEQDPSSPDSLVFTNGTFSVKL